MKLSIIIPLFNEETNIVPLLKELEQLKFPGRMLNSVEFIIVDDFSSDHSYQVARQFISDKSAFQIFKHESNKGKGAAVRTGIEKATGDLFLIQDADLELSTTDIPAMVEALRILNVEFINGSRYLPGVVRPLASFRRYWGNRIFTNLTSVLINVKLTDVACGYKLIHRDLYNKLQLREDRFGFEAELVIKALRLKKNNVAEVPVKYFPRNAGEGKKLNNRDAFKILWTIFKYGVLRLK